jgi:hypothetical protein
MQNDSHILGVYLTYLLFSFPELSKNKIVCPLIHHFVHHLPRHRTRLGSGARQPLEGWPAKP